jgi:hypothetical protein
VTDRGLNDMRCFRGGLTLGVHKIPFLEFFPKTSWILVRGEFPLFPAVADVNKIAQ